MRPFFQWEQIGAKAVGWYHEDSRMFFLLGLKRFFIF